MEEEGGRGEERAHGIGLGKEDDVARGDPVKDGGRRRVLGSRGPASRLGPFPDWIRCPCAGLAIPCCRTEARGRCWVRPRCSGNFVRRREVCRGPYPCRPSPADRFCSSVWLNRPGQPAGQAPSQESCLEFEAAPRSPFCRQPKLSAAAR
jgi:hypothetical protein